MLICRAIPDDHDRLVELIERFYAVDGHEFDSVRVDAGLLPLLRDDGFTAEDSVWVSRQFS